MSRSFVNAIERGDNGTNVVRLLRLAAALGMALPERVDLPSASAPAADRAEGLPS
jgi:hypothetical protein